MTAYKYTEEALREAAANATSNRSMIIAITGNERPSGGSQNHIAKLVKQYGIDTSHFKGQGHGRGGRSKESSSYFALLPDGSARVKVSYLRNALLEAGVKEECSCGQGTEWNGKHLRLQVDHIDGNYLNNLQSNLRFLCPNCHTQTETWGSKVRMAELVDAHR